MSWDVTGKTVLLTGATSGIGLEAAVQLARRGARVAMVGRDERKLAACAADVRRRSGSQLVSSLVCDFSRQADVRKLAADFRAQHDRLDVLVNNAGTVFVERTLTPEGIEATFAVNHLGYFFLTSLLLDLVVKSAPARIVNVASNGHRRGTLDFDDLGFARGYGIMKAYTRSKLCNVLFTHELARRLAGRGVTVNALHPGPVATNIWSHAPRWTQPVFNLAARWFFISAERGGENVAHLVVAPGLEGVTGRYFDQQQEREPSKRSQDAALALRLWEASAKLTGASGQA